MKTSNPSEKVKNPDVNESSNEKRNLNQSQNKENIAQQAHGKGTGMSSEAGSNQTEKSWQDTNGSQANSGNKNSNNKDLNKSGSQK